MQENSLFTLSNTRLPFDHFISGALIAGMGAAALGFSDYLNNRATKKDVAKKIAKYAVTGGFVGAVGIHASNLIAQKKYLNAAAFAAAGIGGLLIAEELIKLESK